MKKNKAAKISNITLLILSFNFIYSGQTLTSPLIEADKTHTIYKAVQDKFIQQPVNFSNKSIENRRNKMLGLSKILAAYHFLKEEDQLNIVRLLQLAGCLEVKQMSEDLRIAGFDATTIEQITNAVAKNSSAAFDPKIILNLFSGLEKTPADLEKIHNWLIKITQREFFARAQGQERWQQPTGKWMTTNAELINKIIDQLRLRNEVPPTQTQYDAIAVLGSTTGEMEKRIAYPQEYVDKRNMETKIVYLLAGERPADKAIDGSEEFLLGVAIANNKKAAKEVTETDLMKHAYQTAKGQDAFSKLPFVVIDTPKGDKPRPNTIDTVELLVDTIIKSGIKIGSILFISRAPNIYAQAEDILNTMSVKLPGVKVEIAGGACDNGVTINRVIGALGGSWFGGYARVAKLLGSTKTPKELKDMLETLKFQAPATTTATAPVTAATSVTAAAAAPAPTVATINAPKLVLNQFEAATAANKAAPLQPKPADAPATAAAPTHK